MSEYLTGLCLELESYGFDELLLKNLAMPQTATPLNYTVTLSSMPSPTSAVDVYKRQAMGSAPGPRPLFCKKAGQKTFKRQSPSSPSPSPWRRVIQSVREADTLAAEGHLPREWERRCLLYTSRCV